MQNGLYMPFDKVIIKKANKQIIPSKWRFSRPVKSSSDAIYNVLREKPGKKAIKRLFL